MPRNVSGRGRAAKSKGFRIRKEDCQIKKPIHPVMRRFKELMLSRRLKPAWELHYITHAGPSTCEKLMSGDAQPSAMVLQSLIMKEFGYDVVVQGMVEYGMSEARPEPKWPGEIESLFDIKGRLQLLNGGRS